MPKPILYIDDQPHYARLYVEALEEADYEVIFCERAELGLAYLRAHASSLGVVILDYMMPTPKGVSDNETLDGKATGRWLLRQARELLEACRLPVIVLTNRSIPVVTTEIEELTLMEIGTLIHVCHKTQTSTRDLVAHVNHLLR